MSTNNNTNNNKDNDNDTPIIHIDKINTYFNLPVKEEPTLLTILQYPDPRLHTLAKPVTVFDETLRRLVRDMAYTMYKAPGVGLAATQINNHQRIVVMDCSESADTLMVLINPEIIGTSTALKSWEEGCLSVPDVYEKVIRPELITIKALDITGKLFEFEAEGLMSVCIQHEIDHLNGKVFVQHLSQLKQGRIKHKLTKIK
jgi:peptide deformylase